MRDPESETNRILLERALSHEISYLEDLRAAGHKIVDVSDEPDRFGATIDAMKSGVDVIYQGALRDQEFAGYTDFLQKVPGGSRLGNYHYEPWDAKLGLSEKPYFLIQLACYADMLALVQGVSPLRVHVVLGNKNCRTFRTDDYVFYYRELRRALIEQQSRFDVESPPELLQNADFGRWKTHVQSKLEEMDHLCRIANIRSDQIRKLNEAGIRTMKDLVLSTLETVPKMHAKSFATLQQQARLQVESRGLDRPKFELLTPQESGVGLRILPPPSRNDVYFDMEGFPLVAGGLEYLFGATIIENGHLEFIDWWALDKENEKAAFEEFVAWVHARWREDRRMHVYHYAAYEKSAIKRLMGIYGTMEREVDDLLRHEVFVDLFSVVRNAIKLGEPNYSIKSVEHLYKEKRAGDVATAMDSVVFFQKWLDLRDGADWHTSKILSDIRSYNKEDCDSTYQLAEWLRKLQAENDIQPHLKTLKEVIDEADPGDLQTEALALASQLLAKVASGVIQDLEKVRVCTLLAHLLEFHRREAKPVFWAMFDRVQMTDRERFDDAACLAGLERTNKAPEPIAKSHLYEYAYNPEQDSKIDLKSRCYYAHDLNQTTEVGRIEPGAGLISLKNSAAKGAPPDNLSLILDEFVNAKPIPQAIMRIVSQYSSSGVLPNALKDFLFRKPPSIVGVNGILLRPGENVTDGTTRLIAAMQDSTLCIQGPPGAGKTYTAAKAICTLIASGKKVGITSNSHKAISNLMLKAAEEARKLALPLRGYKLQNHNEKFEEPAIVAKKANDFFSKERENFDIVGGTAWTFANEQAENLLDYLFVDEAGQVSVANLVAMAASTRNIVMIGDQMQLSQPIQGSHPGDSGLSLLEYFLEGKQVVPEDVGIFLGTTWRMHPDVCSFISGAVYEDKLLAEERTSRRSIQTRIGGPPPGLKSSGILYVPVEHDGNVQDSEEEAEVISKIVDDLLECKFVDGSESRKLSLEDILLVAPYNMQVRRLRNRIPGCAVGSVDKFQGQEAPVVIISMCASDGDSSARGMEFIFSKNRLNVAISRAKCLAIIVGSPSLARTKCSSVAQLELVNLFCRLTRH